MVTPWPFGFVRLLDVFCAVSIFAAVALWAADVEAWTVSRLVSLFTGLWTCVALLARR